VTSLQNILIDAETLASSAKEDMERKEFATYPGYIDEFNRLLSAAKEAGLEVDMKPIAPVPEGQLAAYMGVGAGTPAEREKLREIVNSSSRLYVRISSYQETPRQGPAEPILSVQRLCDRFHTVVKQLLVRREGRPTLKVNDEYDVQDLLHALLKVAFDDVRPEEYGPSFAGRPSRMDFLLKSEEIVVEVKKTREGLADKKLGEELIVDIARYAKHSDCKTLVCFVYDPEERLSNPRALESDLTSNNQGLRVLTFVRPKRD